MEEPLVPGGIHLVDYRPDAFIWMPENLATVRVPKHPDCNCNGSGSMGNFKYAQPGGFSLSREVPCACVYAVVPSDKKEAVAEEIKAHFTEVREAGRLCPCLYCAKRRQLEDEGKIGSNSQN